MSIGSLIAFMAVALLVFVAALFCILEAISRLFFGCSLWPAKNDGQEVSRAYQQAAAVGVDAQFFTADEIKRIAEERGKALGHSCAKTCRDAKEALRIVDQMRGFSGEVYSGIDVKYLKPTIQSLNARVNEPYGLMG